MTNIYIEKPKVLVDNQTTDHHRVDQTNLPLVSQGSVQSRPEDFPVQAFPDGYSYKHVSSGAINTIVKASPGFLHAIIFGGVTSAAGGQIEVSDSATDGDGNKVVDLLNPTVGTYIVDAYFATGIAADTNNGVQTTSNVTYIYR